MNEENLMLVNSLMMLVQQYFHIFNKDGFVCVSHSNINAEENAIDTLVELGFAEEIEEGMNGYRLRFDKLQNFIEYNELSKKLANNENNA